MDMEIREAMGCGLFCSICWKNISFSKFLFLALGSRSKKMMIGSGKLTWAALCINGSLSETDLDSNSGILLESDLSLQEMVWLVHS